MAIFPLLLVSISAILHVSWNMFAKNEQSTVFFLRLNLIVTTVGLVPCLILEYIEQPIIYIIWPQLLLAGLGQTLYYVGLAKSYKDGDFALVYPLSRAIPVLIIGLLDVYRNNAPSTLGWSALILITLGCLLAPIPSWRDISIKNYWNNKTAWILIAALGTICYTAADSSAAKLIPIGLSISTRYHTLSLTVGLLLYWITLSIVECPPTVSASLKTWRVAAISTVAMFASYTLVIWAYQITDHSSYIMGVRQVSIVLGTIAAILIFNEKSPQIKLIASSLITLGALIIALFPQ